MLQKLLFIDRDGTIIVEPTDYQVDSMEKLQMMPGAVEALSWIAANLDYTLVMVTNQDGLGTPSFPEEQFWPAQNEMVEILREARVVFSEVLIDRTHPHEKAPTRKPGIGLVKHYCQGNCDLKSSYVIGDRLTDLELAKNLGAKGILLKGKPGQSDPQEIARRGLKQTVVLIASDWAEIAAYLEKHR